VRTRHAESFLKPRLRAARTDRSNQASVNQWGGVMDKARDPRAFRYSDDRPLILQSRWYVEAVVFSAALAFLVPLVRGRLGAEGLGEAAIEAVIGVPIVLLVTGALHLWRRHRA